MRRTRRQRLGQHFLRDARIAQAIAAAVPQDPPRVLEVGPGKGALTAALLARFPQVRTVEIDAHLAQQLAETLGQPQGLEVVRGDALRLSLEELAAEGPWNVAANLPYAVATPILRRFLWAPDSFPSLVVMVQKEVAQRLLANAGDGERGALSVEFQLLADGELLFTVPPRCFSPPPQVMSAVVRLRANPKAEPALLQQAVALARHAFTHRRKKLVNALAGAREDLSWLLPRSGVDGNLRPQELTLEQWLALARARRESP